MRFVVIILLSSTIGCDKLFGLNGVSEPEDATTYSTADAVNLDTAGWPTNGGFIRPACLDPHDEDGDLVMDDCDNCPLDPNDQVDLDQDGIGDICDPYPMFAVQRRAYFDGFNVDGSKPPVTGQGDYDVVDGLLKQTGVTTGRTLLVLDGGPWRNPTIEIKFGNVRRASTNNTSDLYAGLYVLNDPMPTVILADGLQCRARFGAEPNLGIVRVRDGLSNPTSVAMFSTPLESTPPVTLVLSAAQLGAPPVCDGERLDLPPNQLATRVLLPTDPTDVEVAKVGVWTFNAKVDFEGFVVYETTYPP